MTPDEIQTNKHKETTMIDKTEWNYSKDGRLMGFKINPVAYALIIYEADHRFVGRLEPSGMQVVLEPNGNFEQGFSGVKSMVLNKWVDEEYLYQLALMLYEANYQFLKIEKDFGKKIESEQAKLDAFFAKMQEKRSEEQL